MLKREREDFYDRDPQLTNGVKIQKVAQAAERSTDDHRRATSQEPSGGFPAKKGQRQRSSSTRAEDMRTEVYKEGRKLKPPRFPEEGDSCWVMVKARTLWGSDVYTHDSDLVAVLMHCGYVNNIVGIPRTTVSEAQVTLEYTSSAKSYPSVFRNGVRSRAWGYYENGCSYRIVRCMLVSRLGGELELEPHPDGQGAVVPTFTPAHFERSISTRATASNLERRQRALHVRDLHGKSSNPGNAARFRKGILHAFSNPADHVQTGLYRFSRCKKALPLAKMRKMGLPLPQPELDVIGSGLVWEDIQFSSAGVSLKGVLYPILRFHFTSCS